MKNRVIHDLHINSGFACKSFSKAANWPSSCVTLQISNKVLAVAQADAEVFTEFWLCFLPVEKTWGCWSMA